MINEKLLKNIIENEYGNATDKTYCQEYINGITDKAYRTTTMYRNSTLTINAGETVTLATLGITTHGRPLMVFVSIYSKAANSRASGRLYIDDELKTSITTIGTTPQDYNDMTIISNVEAGTHSFQFRIQTDSTSGDVTVYPYYINSFTIIEL